jgi:enhancing lycopene biosynthesis protein 2
MWEQDRNLLIESSRITRGAHDLFDLSKAKSEHLQALIIPPFSHLYSKSLVEDLHNIAVVRSIIKEFHLRKKYIVPIGPTAINLVGKSL